MNATTQIPTLTDTGKTARCAIDGTAYPVYHGPHVDPGDGRVRLPDGRLAYAVEDYGNTLDGLYLELLAMDAGDNVHRRYEAATQSTGGITAPILGAGSLTAIGSKQVGWLDA